MSFCAASLLVARRPNIAPNIVDKRETKKKKIIIKTALYCNYTLDASCRGVRLVFGLGQNGSGLVFVIISTCSCARVATAGQRFNNKRRRLNGCQRFLPPSPSPSRKIVPYHIFFPSFSVFLYTKRLFYFE